MKTLIDLKLKLNPKYLCAFIIVLIIETAIALFVHDNFIRPHMGDVLVVVLINFFIKAFVENEDIELLPLYIFIFAVLVEIGQYFYLVELLGLNNFRIARIILGSTFDIKDIICYLIGCLGLFLLHLIPHKKKTAGLA